MEYVKLNEEGIKYIDVYTEEELVLYFTAARYNADNTIAIMCDLEDGEPFENITVCLSSYYMKPMENFVFVSHNVPRSLLVDFIKEFGTGNTYPIQYGMANSIAMELNERTLKMLESLD